MKGLCRPLQVLVPNAWAIGFHCLCVVPMFGHIGNPARAVLVNPCCFGLDA